MPGHNVPIGAADAERQRAHQHRAIGRRWIGNVFNAGRAGDARRDGECAHAVILPWQSVRTRDRRALTGG